MFVVMATQATEAEVNGVKGRILAEGLTPFEHVGTSHTVIAVVGDIGARRPELMSLLGALPGVDTITPISRPYKLVSREFHPEDSVIRVLDAVIGDGSLTVMAGPCSVESREQLFETVDHVATARRHVLRGGAFKPRTSPYASRGWASRASATSPKRASGPVCRSSPRSWSPRRSTSSPSTPTSSRSAPATCRTSRCCRPSAASARPVMLKRGYGATIEEWLMAAEYIVSAGQPQRDPVRARHPDVRDVHAATRSTSRPSRSSST